MEFDKQELELIKLALWSYAIDLDTRIKEVRTELHKGDEINDISRNIEDISTFDFLNTNIKKSKKVNEIMNKINNLI